VVDEVAAKVPNDADRQARWMITSERSDAKLWRFMLGILVLWSFFVLMDLSYPKPS
jgi:hypothetical protein